MVSVSVFVVLGEFALKTHGIAMKCRTSQATRFCLAVFLYSSWAVFASCRIQVVTREAKHVISSLQPDHESQSKWKGSSGCGGGLGGIFPSSVWWCGFVKIPQARITSQASSHSGAQSRNPEATVQFSSSVRQQCFDNRQSFPAVFKPSQPPSTTKKPSSTPSGDAPSHPAWMGARLLLEDEKVGRRAAAQVRTRLVEAGTGKWQKAPPISRDRRTALVDFLVLTMVSWFFLQTFAKTRHPLQRFKNSCGRDCTRMGLLQTDLTIRRHVLKMLKQGMNPEQLGFVQRHAAAQEKDDNVDVDVCDSINAFTDHDSGHDSDHDSDDDLDAGDLEQEVRLAWLQQQVEDNLREGRLADGADEGELSTDGLSCKLFRNGLLTRDAVLDMLAELAAFHHAPRALMEAVVDIINLVVLDGGAPAPVIPGWQSFEKSMFRSTAHIRKKYFVCPNECKEGVSEWKGTVPPRCRACHKDIAITPEKTPQWMLRHLDVKESLAAMLAHPDVQRYIPVSKSTCMPVRLCIPKELRGSPAWKKYIRDPNVLTLALFFDGIPCFRTVNTTYSVQLVTLEILNLPFFLHSDSRFTVFNGIIPGPSKPRLLCHNQLGYEGCTKCKMRAVKVGDFYDWRHPEGADPPRRKTHENAIRYGRNAAISAEGQYKGFQDVPIFAQLQKDCIKQAVEDALHLVEGCIKRHIFALLMGGKKVERPGKGKKWEEWLRKVEEWGVMFTQEKQRILDQRWLAFCAATGRTTNAAPCRNPDDVTGSQILRRDQSRRICSGRYSDSEILLNSDENFSVISGSQILAVDWRCCTCLRP
eukprot:g62203.t1